MTSVVAGGSTSTSRASADASSLSVSLGSSTTPSVVHEMLSDLLAVIASQGAAVDAALARSAHGCGGAGISAAGTADPGSAADVRGVGLSTGSEGVDAAAPLGSSTAATSSRSASSRSATSCSASPTSTTTG